MVLGILAIQGFVLSFILLMNKRGMKIANRVLGLLLLFFSLMLLEEALELLGLNAIYPRITASGFLVELFLGPLTYLYSLILTNDDFKLDKRSAIHFAIPILLNITYIPYHFVVEWDSHLINNESLALLLTVVIAVKILYQIIYQVSAIRNTINYLRNTDRSTISDTHYSTVIWLRNILTAVLVLIPLVLLVENIQSSFKFDSDYVTSGIMLVSIYSIGYVALNNPMVYARETEIPEVGRPLFPISSKAKYRTSSLKESEKNHFTDKLKIHMEEQKPYLNPDLTFDDLAEDINLSSHHLSQVLNEVLNQNFYEFVNSYRVKEVVERMERGEYEKVKILTLGFESGFNSKATFNRAFKKSTGLTPLGYIRNLKAR